MAKTDVERAREYRARIRERQFQCNKLPKKPPKSGAQRKREYRARKKLLKILQQNPFLSSSIPLTTGNYPLLKEAEVAHPGGMDDSKLIELVKSNEHLYDQSRKDYRDAALRKKTWESIAEAMSCSMDECHKRFRYLRYRLCRLKKLGGAEAASDPSMPHIFQQMMFLWDHLLIKNNCSSCPDTEDSSFYVEPENGIKCEVELIEGEFVEDLYNSNNEEGEHSTYVEISAQNSENSVLPDLKQQETDSIEDESYKELRTADQECSNFIVQSPNEEFAALVKNYLDQIIDSEKQSSMRLNILNYLHKEIFK